VSVGVGSGRRSAGVGSTLQCYAASLLLCPDLAISIHEEDAYCSDSLLRAIWLLLRSYIWWYGSLDAL
jgi:hypothetical protein